MDAGTIIYLNGTSSAGKTSIALALQDLLPAPYLHVRLDRFPPMFPRKYVAVQSFGQPIPPLSREGLLLQYGWHEGRLDFEDQLGPAGRRFARGFRQTMRALAVAGNNLIVDDVLQELF